MATCVSSPAGAKEAAHHAQREVRSPRPRRRQGPGWKWERPPHHLHPLLAAIHRPLPPPNPQLRRAPRRSTGEPFSAGSHAPNGMGGYSRQAALSNKGLQNGEAQTPHHVFVFDFSRLYGDVVWSEVVITGAVAAERFVAPLLKFGFRKGPPLQVCHQICRAIGAFYRSTGTNHLPDSRDGGIGRGGDSVLRSTC